MDNSISVVVFYESSDVRKLVDKLLGSEHQNIFYSNLKQEQKEFISFAKRDHKSFLFLYAFDHPKFAIELHQLIHAHESVKKVIETPHLSILFCNRAHRKQALLECQSKRFYCYETFNPIVDAQRTRLSIELAADLLITKNQLKQLETENASVLQNLNHVSNNLDSIEGSIFDEQGIQSGLLDDLAEGINELFEREGSSELLPIPSEQRIADDSNNVKSDLKNFKSHNQTYFSSLGEQISSVKPKVDSREPLVIVADDQIVMQKIITTILKPKGFKVSIVSNGEEAILKAKASQPQVILLDIDMPVKNGVETLKELKEIEKLKLVPVIMLTSNSDKSSFIECRELGAVDYIVKPTNADILLKKVLSVL